MAGQPGWFTADDRDLHQPDQRSRIMDEIFKKSLDALDIRCTFKVAKWPDQLKAARAGNYMIWCWARAPPRPTPPAP